MAASTPDTVNPVSDQCEANGMPCVTNDCPLQPYVLGRGGNETSSFQWTYHTFWGLEDVQATFLDMWTQVPNNKTAAAMFPNDADGNAWRPAWEPVFKDNGYKEVDPGPFQNGTEDFTQQIAQFKKEACELTMGVFIPPDFTNYWKQCSQQGYTPKIATFAKALLFPQSLEALGDVGIGLTTEVWWTPMHPFKSSLTGETCQEFADEFTKRTTQQWTQPLLHYIVFEHVYDALKRASDPMDPAAIIEAVKTTKIDTIGGPIDFTAPVVWGKVGPGHAHANVYKTPVVGGQWIKGTTYPYELAICSNAAASIVPTTAKVQSLI
jgi:branched-chain amino acid transport system substrate-binding protein